ncbi:hypothetical protein WJX74_000794 [Apatococcus lobatus]|uniref:START domain-containing protein n=1 Tax=Apatococcus lobatus TaxID=904363 RepID=A0AAW1S8W0_9CHLO
MGLRKWIKKQSGKRSDKAGRRKTEDQVGSSPAINQAGQARPARPDQAASRTTTSPNATLQNAGVSTGLPAPMATSVTTVTTPAVSTPGQGPVTGSTTQPVAVSQTTVAPAAPLQRRLTRGSLPPASFQQAHQMPPVPPANPATQVSLADIPATSRMDRAESGGSFVSARSHASEWSQAPSRTASSNLDPLDLGPVSSYDRAAAASKSSALIGGGDRAYRRPDHAAVTQAVIDLEAAAEQPRTPAVLGAASAGGYSQPSMPQQTFASQPVQPSLTAGQLAAAGEQGYSPAGVGLQQHTVAELPQAQQAGALSSFDHTDQHPSTYLPAPEASAQGAQDFRANSQIGQPHMERTMVPSLQGSDGGHAIPTQQTAGLGPSISHAEVEASRQGQQGTATDDQQSNYAFERHSALMQAAGEHERAMQAERSSAGQVNAGTLMQPGHAGTEQPAPAAAVDGPTDEGLLRASYASDRHAALMRAAEAHEQAFQAQADPFPASSGTEPVGGYASDRHAALMKAALAHEQPYDHHDGAPMPAGGHQAGMYHGLNSTSQAYDHHDGIPMPEVGHQAGLPNGTSGTQSADEAAAAGGYASDRHAALMRAAEEHEQRLLQSPQPSPRQELFYVSDRHAALMRAAEQHENRPFEQAADPVAEQGPHNGSEGYGSDRHAALMAAVAAYEQTPEVEQPPEQVRHDAMRSDAPVHASSQHVHPDHGPHQQNGNVLPPMGSASMSQSNGGMYSHELTHNGLPQGDAVLAKQQVTEGYQPAANGHHDQAYLQGASEEHALGHAPAGAVQNKLPASSSSPGPQQDINQLYNGGQNMLRDGRILQAYKLLEQLCQQRGLPFPGKAQQVMPSGPLTAATILQEAARIKQAQADLVSSTSWPVIRDAPGDLSVWYQHKSGSPIHSVRLEGTFATSIECLLAMGREFDLASTWNSYMLDSLILSEPSLFEATLYASNWLPFPFSPCDCIVHAKGYDLAQEDRSLFMLMETPEQAPEKLPGQPLPAAYSKRKHTAMVSGSCMRMQPVQPGPDGKPRTKGSMLVHLDPKVSFVPSWLMTFILKVMSPFAYKQMVQVLEEAFSNPNAEIPRRMAAKPELYARLHERTAASVPWDTSDIIAASKQH